MNIELIRQIGLGGWVLVAIILLLIWIVKTVIKESSQRDKAYTKLVENHITHNVNTMEHLVSDMDNNSKSNSEAHRFQRDEHNKQMESLVKLVAVLDSMDRRMNGKK